MAKKPTPTPAAPLDMRELAIGEYQLARALLDVLARQLGPNFAGAVREELLARAEGLEQLGSDEAAAATRKVVADRMWNDLTGRRPAWTLHEPPKV